jgi:pimeloyl-ACP methyl ester carboxylesterase
VLPREHAQTAVPLTRVGPPAPERFGYLPAGSDQIYYVQHLPRERPVAKVLLAGPLGLERQTAYCTWLRWARHLASEKLECLHFDYRGMGESTGRFEDYHLHDWKDDLLAALRFLRGVDDVPVFLMGLRLGALLAARLFEEGEGDGLLLWDPPASGQGMLTEVLRRKLASDLMEGVAGPRKSRDAYIADLLRGGSVEVEGYRWTQRLWTDAVAFPFKLPSSAEARPWMLVHLDGRPLSASIPAGHAAAVPIPKPPFWGHDPFVLARVSELFGHGTGFLRAAARQGRQEP